MPLNKLVMSSVILIDDNKIAWYDRFCNMKSLVSQQLMWHTNVCRFVKGVNFLKMLYFHTIDGKFRFGLTGYKFQLKRLIEASPIISQLFTNLFELKLRASKSTTNVQDVHVKSQIHLNRNIKVNCYQKESRRDKKTWRKPQKSQVDPYLLNSYWFIILELKVIFLPLCQTHSGHLTAHECRPLAGLGRSWGCGKTPPPPGVPAPWLPPAGADCSSERSQRPCWSQLRGPGWTTAAAT